MPCPFELASPPPPLCCYLFRRVVNLLRLGWVLRFFKWLKYFFCDTRNPIVQVRVMARLLAVMPNRLAGEMRRAAKVLNLLLCAHPVCASLRCPPPTPFLGR